MRRSTPRRATEGGPALDLSIALHFGDVVYGNIGTARRLDFTVIGPAVNEASRMEALCKELGSEAAAVAEHRPALRPSRARASGRTELRGTAGTREIYGLARPRTWMTYRPRNAFCT